MVVADTQTFFAIFVANQIDLWLRLRRAVTSNQISVHSVAQLRRFDCGSAELGHFASFARMDRSSLRRARVILG
jgi:hypothetical protein